jgi:ABC-type phosphate transport system auxiliary subunit
MPKCENCYPAVATMLQPKCDEIDTLRARVEELEKLTVDQANIILISMENAEHRIALQNQLAASQAENARLREDLDALSEKLNEFIRVEITGESK